MGDRDLHELRDLARVGEHRARPLPAETVRALGTRRRRRRHAAVSGLALVLAAVVGGTALSQNTYRSDVVPNPAASRSAASPAPTPVRTVVTANLLTPADIPVQVDTQQVKITKSGIGRPWDQASACFPDGGVTGLGARVQLSRNFRYQIEDPDYTPDPDDLRAENPVYYTQAFQFADAAAASRAEDTVRGWLDDCVTLLEEQDYTVLGGPDLTWTDVRSGSATVGAFASVRPYREPDDKSQEGYFESVGLTQVEDRLMLTVRAHYGQDDNVSLERGGDPDLGMPEHPQFALVTAAAERLAD